MVLRDIFFTGFDKCIRRMRKYFQQRKLIQLKDLSNDCIKEAVMHNDPLYAELAVIAYSLHKLLSKVHIVENKKFPSLQHNVLESLDKSIRAIERHDISGFENSLKNTVKNVNAIDQKMGNYAQKIYDKSKVKMASSAYAYGLSLGKASQLTGAHRKDVQKYIGFTTIHDELREKIGIKPRVDALKKALK